MARTQLVNITLLKNTPLTDFQNTIHFKSNYDRDNAMLNNYEKYEFDTPFQFVKNRGQFSAPIPYLDTIGYNYCTFIEPVSNVRYYAYIMNFEYETDGSTLITIVIDTVMTWTQGTVLQDIKNVLISRQHLSNTQYQARLKELQTNDDIIKTTTKQYVHQDVMKFDDTYVLFQASNNLEVSAGTVNEPKMKTSKGMRYDHLTSPVNLYICDIKDYSSIMDKLSDFPWVSQNVKAITLIPKTFVDAEDIVTAKLLGESSTTLKKLKDGGWSRNVFEGKVARSLVEIGRFGGIDITKEPHLLRSEYMTCEIYSYDGQNINIDLAQLPQSGLDFGLVNSIGYFNQIAIYPIGYGSTPSEKDNGEYKRGKFLNNAIIFNNFTELPNLVDNYTLGMARGANQRQLAEDRLISGRVSNVLNPNSFNSFEGITSKVFDSMSVLSNGLSLSGVASKMTDEYEFYRTQKAQFADLKLSSPTITGQSNGYAFQIANSIFGLVVKYSAPQKAELDKVRQYYSMFGFEFNQNGTIDNPESMTVCNYLKFSGAWSLPRIPTDQMQILKSLFEGGIRFWHYDNTANPMKQDILKNTRR